MAVNPIEYKTLVRPDDSIQNLIDQLLEADETHDKITKNIVDRAKKLREALKSVNGAAGDQRNEIEKAVKETDDLAKAQIAVEKASSDTTKEIAKLKKEQQEIVKLTKLQTKVSEAAEGSYDKLAAQYALNKVQLNKMSAEMRKSTEEGRDLEFTTAAIAEEMRALKQEEKEQAQVLKLQTKLADSAEGSYDALSAEYALNKIELNKMSEAMRNNTEEGKALEKQTNKIYQEMKRLQEATGKHTLNVGNYEEALTSANKKSKTFAQRVAERTGRVSEQTEALGDLVPAFGKAGQAVAAFGKQLIALIATNPILLLIAAIVGLLAGLFKAWTQNAAGAQLLEQGLAALSAIFETITSRIGSFLTGQISFKELLFETHKEIAENVKASVALVKARKDLERTTRENAHAEALLGRQIAKLRGIRDADSKTLTARKNAAISLTKVEVDQAKIRVKQAEDEAKLQVLALKSLTKGSVDYRKAQLELMDAERAVIEARSELTTVQLEAAEALGKIRLDIFEQELDLELDVTDRKKKLNEDRIKNDQLTLAEQRKLANENVKIIEESFDRQIAAFERLFGKQLDEQALLQMSGAEIKKYAELLGVDVERAVNRLREVVIEKNQADRDNLITIKEIDAAERKLAADRIKRAEEERKNRLRLAQNTIDQLHALTLTEIDLMEVSEEEKTKLRLQAERKRLQAILNLNKAFGKELSSLQIQTLENQIKLIDKQIEDVNKKMAEGPTFFEKIGVNDEQQEQIKTGYDQIKQSISSVFATRLESANQTQQVAAEELENARQNLEQQLALRAAGEEADVEGALNAFNQKKAINDRALENQRKAQRAQNRIQTLEQTSALITSAAQIFKGFTAAFPLFGSVLAIPVIAAMFGAFAAQKVQARKATRSFGGGGEFDIMGGSHASGNDVSLGYHNGVHMKAEGGEKAAIFNKQAVRKYGPGLTGLIAGVNSRDLDLNILKHNAHNAQVQNGIDFVLESKGADTRELYETKERFKSEMEDIVSKLPQPIASWDDSGYRRYTKRENTITEHLNNQATYE